LDRERRTHGLNMQLDDLLQRLLVAASEVPGEWQRSGASRLEDTCQARTTIAGFLALGENTSTTCTVCSSL
jgi:hypothetical protein